MPTTGTHGGATNSRRRRLAVVHAAAFALALGFVLNSMAIVLKLDTLAQAGRRVRALVPEEKTIARPLSRRMADTANPIFFLHVGKAGGTSLDTLFLEDVRVTALLRDKNKTYIGDLHYDWSFVQELQRMILAREARRLPLLIRDLKRTILNGTNVRRPWDGSEDAAAEGFDVSDSADVIIVLRHPVARAFSQFSFSKTLPWAKRSNATFLKQTFEEYLDDPHKTWTQPIADGEGGVDFLAGIFPVEVDAWVKTDGRETAFKRHLRSNRTAACLLAARRLDGTLWFGLLEDAERSTELLRRTLGLEDTVVLPTRNAGGGRDRSGPSAVAAQKVARRLPQDLWLYEYGRRLFEARWMYVVGGGRAYDPPTLPPLPEF